MNNATFRLKLCEALTFSPCLLDSIFFVQKCVPFSRVPDSTLRFVHQRFANANANVFAKISKLSIDQAKWILLNTFVDSKQLRTLSLNLNILAEN